MTKTPVTLSRPITRIEAARIVQTAGTFEARVMMQHGQNIINVKSMLGLLSLCTTVTDGLELVTDGADEKEAAAAVAGAFTELL